MYYHPQYQHPAIDRETWSEEQLLRDVVYLLRNPKPFVIEPAYSIVELVRRQIAKGLPEPWKVDADEFGQFTMVECKGVFMDYPDYAMEMAYALLTG